MNNGKKRYDDEQMAYKKPAEMILRQVGIIKNEIKEPILLAGDEGLKMQEELDSALTHVHEVREGISKIIIDEDLVDVLDGIVDYSHLLVLYWAHKVPEKSRSLTKVHPMGSDEYPLKGIFSTCSPARPNPVLLTVVQLIERKDNVLEVSGLDAIDGSPVIDIKPYVSDVYPQKEVSIPKWMNQILREVEKRNL